jgi:hypothetical protein
VGEPVDPHDPHPGVQGDVVVEVPVHRVEVDLVGVLAGQHVREHDPVVVAVRFVAEHGDPEPLPATATTARLGQTGPDLPKLTPAAR